MAEKPKPATGDDDKDLGPGGKKALDEERRARRDAERQLQEVRDELKTVKDSRQSDEEKVTTKLADLERRANEADARAMRAEVAQSKGLSTAQAKRLQGSTREELEADADDLIETFPNPEKGAGEEKSGRQAPSRRPAENLQGGGDPSPPAPAEMDPAKLASSVPRL